MFIINFFVLMTVINFGTKTKKKNDQLNEIRELKAKHMLTTYPNPDVCVVREIRVTLN